MHNEVLANELIYQLHPSTIDACIQLFSAAASGGQPRNLTELSVPSAIESLYIARPEGEMDMFAEAFSTPRGKLTGNGVATSNGTVVLEMKDLKLSPVECKDEMRGPDPHAACRLHWKPDIDFLSISELVRASGVGRSLKEYYLPVERLALLCTIESNLEARERFSEHDNMKYSVLDISKDPINQGFEAGSYDLIIAANVLHATPRLSETLRNVHKLLTPDGHLVLDELSSTIKWLNYIMGTLPGWWLGKDDG